MTMRFSNKIRNWLFILGAIILLILVAFKVVGTKIENFPVSKYYGYDTSIPLRDSVRITIDVIDFTTHAINHNGAPNDEQIAI